MSISSLLPHHTLPLPHRQLHLHSCWSFPLSPPHTCWHLIVLRTLLAHSLVSMLILITTEPFVAALLSHIVVAEERWRILTMSSHIIIGIDPPRRLE